MLEINRNISKSIFFENSNKIFILLPFIFLFLFANIVRAQYAGGTGQENSPYWIYTAEQMNAIGANPEDWDKHFKLMEDVDLSRLAKAKFNIIGTKDTPFSGIFDGNNKKISNFSYTAEDMDCIGVFGYVKGPNALIKNLQLINSNINAETSDYVGGLVGWMHEGTIKNCYVIDGNVSGYGYVGGLVGRLGILDSTSTVYSISNCSTKINVSGTVAVGGLAGYIHPESTVTNSHAVGNVVGTVESDEIGGLVGGNNYGDIINCSASCIIWAGEESTNIGGLAGEYTNGLIECCYSESDIRVNGISRYIGGLIGHITIGTVTNCYTKGIISTAEQSQYIGGLVGFNRSYGTVINCFSTCLIRSGKDSENIGGLVGYAMDPAGYANYGAVIDSFWDIESSGIQSSSGGIGATTAQLKDIDFYSLNGWGGNNNWIIKNGRDYPHLVWEDTQGETTAEPVIDWFDGNGTEEFPYLIATSEQLRLIAASTLLLNKHFKLTSDLDMDGISVTQIGLYEGSGFSGIFNGNGHTIYNLQITTEDKCQGLFGYISTNGKVINLNIDNAIATWPDNSEDVGILAGTNYGDIISCHVIGSIYVGNSATGVGAIAGMNDGTVEHCFADVHITVGDSSRRIGGLIGHNWRIITSCYASGSITTGRDNNQIGGLAGSSSGNNRSNIINCYANNSIAVNENSKWIGGLVGNNSGSKINYSYATGSISTKNNCIDFGTFVGRYLVMQNSTINKCYYLVDSQNELTNNGLGSGLTEMQMKQQVSFEDWDFIDIWTISENQSYPHLKWE